MSAPVLVGCSHGTDSPEGRLAIRSILADVAVREAFVDVQQPEVVDVVAEALAQRGLAVVPGVPDGSDPDAGADGDVAEVGEPGTGADRVVPDGGRVGAVVVPLLLSTGFHVRVDIAASVEGRAAAGSTDPDAARDVLEVTAGLSRTLGRGVAVGCGRRHQPSGPRPPPGGPGPHPLRPHREVGLSVTT